MSNIYRAVDWNRQKRIYDASLLTVLGAVLVSFAGMAWWCSPDFTLETLLIRSTAVAAFLLLHTILAIGPLSRLDPRFLPLLYNRRHLGVTLFAVALVHGVVVVVQFHALGNENPLVSLVAAYGSDYRVVAHGVWQPQHVPFELFGVLALGILFLMAATSHDFWLRQLGASLWKGLHFGVYLAYGLLLAHVGFGALQNERHGVYPVLLGLGFLGLATLHLTAAQRELRRDRELTPPGPGLEGFERACPADAVAEGRGTVALSRGRRIALYRHRGEVYATSNVCRHQGGPVGEGRIVDGCITCPWHGWSYRPEDGCSPPPFTEILPTFETRVVRGEVWVSTEPRGSRQVAPRLGTVPGAGTPPAGRPGPTQHP